MNEPALQAPLGLMRIIELIVPLVLLALAVFHALFALANFGIGEIGEGVVVAVAAISLAWATVVSFRRRWSRAGWVVLAGTLPLVLWFLVTVPLGWSSPTLLFMSLVTPALAVGLVLSARRPEGTT